MNIPFHPEGLDCHTLRRKVRNDEKMSSRGGGKATRRDPAGLSYTRRR